MTTELQTLKMKKRMQKATPEDLTRLKLLQDGEPLSAADLEEAKKREADRAKTDKEAFEAKGKEKAVAGKPACFGTFSSPGAIDCATECRYVEDCKRQNKSKKADAFNKTLLDQPAEHPRIAQIKEALLPFTKIEAHDSRPNEFILFTRGVAITAGDVRKARKAMKI